MDEITAKTIRDSISLAFDKSPKLEGIWKKVRTGTATYEDAHKFANELSNIMCKQLWAQSMSLNGDELSKSLVEELLTKHGKLTNMVCDSVQTTLNNSAGISLKPVPPILNQDKISGVAKAMDNAPSPEEVVSAIEQPFKTCALSNIDEWVQSNASAQKRAGLSPIIKRTFEGAHYDTKSHKMRVCQFCSDLAGSFPYGEEPNDIYVRHLGCKCVVEYFPNALSKGRITALAKGDTDVNKQLWNTGTENSSSRQAVLRRRQKKYGRDEARRILNAEWQGGLNGNAERHF